MTTPPLALSAIRVFVSDLAQATEFYGGVLGLAPLDRDEAAGFAVFAAGPGIMLIAETVDPRDAEEEAEGLVGRFTGISFAVDDIAGRFAAMRAAGVVFDGLPERQPWGGALVQFADPSGNVLTLVEYPKD